MLRFTSLCIIIVLLCSCKKTEKDFTGKYQILYPDEVKLASEFRGMSMFYRTPERHTARKYYELLPVTLNFFVDESDKRLKGEAEISQINVIDFSYKPKASKRKSDFDIVNIRMENDTLGFQIENQLLKLSGKKIKGQIFKKDDDTFIGLEVDALGLNDFTEKNPLFSSKNGDMVYYKALAPGNDGEIKKKFYQIVLDDFKDKLAKSKNESDSIYFENSIKEIQTLNKQ
ncbi:MAG TPA: hypothetical protein VF691_05590 [Cytophagaceae bacterium]|jgi:hypothetical protein